VKYDGMGGVGTVGDALRHGVGISTVSWVGVSSWGETLLERGGGTNWRGFAVGFSIAIG
jgi:hypothetical protein